MDDVIVMSSIGDDDDLQPEARNKHYTLPSQTAHLSVAPWESSQPHPGHVEQPDLPIVVRKSDDFLVHRHADPERSKRSKRSERA